MRRALALLGFVLLTVPGSAAGQWGLALEVGVARFAGTSEDTSAATVNGRFEPYVPMLVGITIDRRIRRATLGLRLTYASGALALETDGPTVFERATMPHAQAALEIAWPLARLGAGARLSLHAGPLIEVWALEGEEARSRLGGQIAGSLDCPLGGRFASAVTVRLGVTPSVFKAGELPVEFVRRASWRTSVAFGLRYGR
ncbi:MAG TPA: hypothetical protein VGA20_04700 [Gemmatimonadales bacterium]